MPDRRSGLRTAALVFAITAAVVVATLPWPCAAAERIITYSTQQRGDVGADYPALRRTAAQAFADPRGWSLGGAIQFRRVQSGGDFVLWLAARDRMTSFSDDCDPQWSCRVGRDVVINDVRFHAGSPYWSGPLDEYRLLLVNHETGHWIGFDHEACGGGGEIAPVMMQQSKGVGACIGNPWPLFAERVRAASLLGVGVPATLASATFDPPRTRGFVPSP